VTPSDDKDERIRLLEDQTDFLRHELDFVKQRHEHVIYSVSWRLALPFRIAEDGLRRLFASSTKPKSGAARADDGKHESPAHNVEPRDQIEAIAGRIEQRSHQRD
jgi:hypothetical protein